MKILYICRLYSGFEESCKTGVWNPKGSPTIARMIERLDQDEAFELELIFTVKDYQSGWHKKTDGTVQMVGLNSPALVLAGKKFFPNWLWKFQEKFSDLRQLWHIGKAYRRFKPDLIYCDRVNIFPAAMLARLTKTPVIWRVMGVLEIMKQAAKAKSLRGIIYRLFWRSPFAHVVCTMDGSGGMQWMDKTLSPKTPRSLLLNGFDFDEPPDPNLHLADAELRILFAGRFEPMKNAGRFLEVAIQHIQDHPSHKVFFAGYGSELETLKQRVADAGANDKIHFLGALNSPEMKAARQQCDIHVSMNTHGNLTNVNLEAMADGLVVLVPETNSDTDVDSDTKAFIPEDIFYRYGSIEDEDAVLQALHKFSDPKTLALWKQRSQKFAMENLETWDQRIQKELEIFHACIK